MQDRSNYFPPYANLMEEDSDIKVEFVNQGFQLDAFIGEQIRQRFAQLMIFMHSEFTPSFYPKMAMISEQVQAHLFVLRMYSLP